MQVQNQLNAFIVLAAFLWCVLAAVTMILQEHSTQAAVIQLWYALNSFEPASDQIPVCMLHSCCNVHLQPIKDCLPAHTGICMEICRLSRAA